MKIQYYTVASDYDKTLGVYARNKKGYKDIFPTGKKKGGKFSLVQSFDDAWQESLREERD